MKKFFVFSTLFAALLVAGFGIQSSAFATGSGEHESHGSHEGNESHEGNNGSEMMTVCHTPPGNPENQQTLTVSEHAFQGYGAQDGYTEGACGAHDDDEVAYGDCDCPPGVACTCLDNLPGRESGAPTAAGPTQFRSF